MLKNHFPDAWFGLLLLLCSCFSALAQQPILVVPSNGIDRKPNYSVLNNPIKQELKKRISINVQNMPLDQAIKLFPAEISHRFQIDRRALDDIGMKPDVQVTMVAKNALLENILLLMLNEIDLTYNPSNGVLLITTPEEAEAGLINEYYHLGEYFKQTDNPFLLERKNLSKVIKAMCAPESWESLGGPGQISAIDEGFLINQTAEVHLEVKNLLNAIRRANELPLDNYDVTPLSLIEASPEQQSCVKRLDQTIRSLRVQDKPLVSVLDELLVQNGINCYIHKRALSDFGLSIDTPISGEWNSQTIDQILRSVLNELDLDTYMQDNILVVSTPEEIESELTVYIYPVKDFQKSKTNVRREEEKETILGLLTPDALDYENLLRVIKYQIHIEDWEEYGGYGYAYCVSEAGCLVVAHDLRVHFEIDKQLASIRAMRTGQPIQNDGVKLADSPISVSYDLEESFLEKNPDLQQVLNRVAIDLLKTKQTAWQYDETSVQIIENQLIVNQKADVQLAIHNYLKLIGALDKSPE